MPELTAGLPAKGRQVLNFELFTLNFELQTLSFKL